jgi:hypothetical protein
MQLILRPALVFSRFPLGYSRESWVVDHKRFQWLIPSVHRDLAGPFLVQ